MVIINKSILRGNIMNKATIKVLIAMLLWGSLGVFVKNISLESVEISFLWDNRKYISWYCFTN